MKFNFSCSKIGNFFFFLENLSEWHPACRRKYNKIWLLQTGPLSKAERQTLKNLKKIFKKYCLKNKRERTQYLISPFFVSRKESAIWKKLTNLISSKELKKLKKSFKIFSSRFEKIWRQEQKNLIIWKKILIRELDKKKYQKIINDFSLLYRVKPKDKTIKIIFLISTPCSFRGYGTRNYITLNLSGNKPNKINKLLAIEIIFHELIHSLFEKNYFLPLLENFLQNQDLKKIENFILNKNIISIRTLINELIASSFLPDGCLSQKYFKRDIKKELGKWKSDGNLILHLKKQNNFKLLRLAEDYLKNKKPLDKDFLKTTFLIVKNFIKKKG